MSKKNDLMLRKPLFFNTILFRLSAINLILLLAFISVIFIISSAMRKSTTTSKTMSQQVISMSEHEGSLKSDVMSLYDQATGYIRSDAAETKEALLSGIQTVRSDINSDINNIREDLKNSGNEEVLSEMDEIDSIYARLNSLIDEAINESDSENGADKAYDTLFDRAEIQKVAIFHACKSIDKAVNNSAAETTATMDSLYAHGIRMAAVGLIFTVILILLSFAFSYGSIIRKIQSIAGEVSSIISDIEDGKGDLTKRIGTKTHSELLLIVDGINHFIETLQQIMKEVKGGIGILSESSSSVDSELALASDNISNTSAGLEQLSAGMETINGAIDSINSKVVDVKDAADAINNESSSRKEMVNEIRSDADDIKKQVSKMKNDASARVESLSGTLSRSVEEAKAVERINELTNVILDISAQTNLLALNASIEAARAGEAGKGFAVVATEISTLAANSRDTAGTIREISSSVTDSVSALASNAEEVLEYINTTVISDYNSFVETGDKYEDTAVAMSDMLDNFDDKANHLHSIMEEMSEAIKNVSESIHESSDAINVSAGASSEIVDEIKSISNAVKQNNDVSERLAKSTSKFAVL